MNLQLERPLAVFDLETTGIKVGQDRIVQVAVVRILPDGSREKWQSLVNPEMPIPAEATAVHGISDADVSDAPVLSEVADELLAQMKDCDLCGFNVLRFDLPFLSEELYRVGITWDTTAIRVVDALRIYHHFERRDLSAAARFYLDQEHGGAHNALADVEMTADVLVAQLDRYADLPKDVAALGEFCGDRKRAPDAAGKLLFDDHGNVCLSFGKYKGWTIENIGRNDPGYMQWLMTKAELPGSTMAVMKNILADIQA
ncbi:MAG: 3'-5' exonuclease [Flavobacteriales bacterium]|jgi:DNA polymerase-3 subunit epsilon|nr:3'-5' exonuclease [Flavobacteriales bacterium]MCI1753132.1 3'-5' exonuclease [Flavobacteriales bacterium]